MNFESFTINTHIYEVYSFTVKGTSNKKIIDDIQVWK